MKRAHGVILSLPILFIPLEVWGEILSHLRLKDLFQCASVCLEWHITDLINKSITMMDRTECAHIDNDRLKKMVNLHALQLDNRLRFNCIRKNMSAELNDNLKALVNLRTLDLSRVKSYININIKPLTNLQSLKLNRVEITCEELSRLPQLRTLEICFGNNTITDDGLTQLTNLTDLSFTTWYSLKGKCLSALPRLKRLELIENIFAYGNVTDEILSGLSNLEELILVGPTRITKNGLKPLVNLKTLGVYGYNSITAEAINQVTSLCSLNLSFCPIDIQQLNKKIEVYFECIECPDSESSDSTSDDDW